MVSIVGERKVSGRGALQISAIKVRPSIGTAYQSHFVQANQQGQEAAVGGISPHSALCSRSSLPKTILILITYGLLEAVRGEDYTFWNQKPWSWGPSFNPFEPLFTQLEKGVNEIIFKGLSTSLGIQKCTVQLVCSLVFSQFKYEKTVLEERLSDLPKVTQLVPGKAVT